MEIGYVEQIKLKIWKAFFVVIFFEKYSTITHLLFVVYKRMEFLHMKYLKIWMGYDSPTIEDYLLSLNMQLRLNTKHEEKFMYRGKSYFL